MREDAPAHLHPHRLARPGDFEPERRTRLVKFPGRALDTVTPNEQNLGLVCGGNEDFRAGRAGLGARRVGLGLYVVRFQRLELPRTTTFHADARAVEARGDAAPAWTVCQLLLRPFRLHLRHGCTVTVDLFPSRQRATVVF